LSKKKLTALISEDLEEELREHIQKRYKRPYGKLSEVVEDSIREYLRKQEKE